MANSKVISKQSKQRPHLLYLAQRKILICPKKHPKDLAGKQLTKWRLL